MKNKEKYLGFRFKALFKHDLTKTEEHVLAFEEVGGGGVEGLS